MWFSHPAIVFYCNISVLFFSVLFVIVELALFLALYLTTLQNNYLLKEEYINDKFDIKKNTGLGFSFFLIPGAAFLYLINIIILVASGYKLRCSFGSEAEKVVDNGMILYWGRLRTMEYQKGIDVVFLEDPEMDWETGRENLVHSKITEGCYFCVCFVYDDFSIYQHNLFAWSSLYIYTAWKSLREWAIWSFGTFEVLFLFI